MGDSRSGGGIVRGASGSGPGDPDMRAFRRRWVSGVIILSITHQESLRGVTVSGFMPLSLDPPSAAVGLQTEAHFHSILSVGSCVGLSMLDRQQEFIAERFAGRAPIPDGSFSGIPHRVHDGVALIDDALAWSIGTVRSRQIEGDHVLVILDLNWFGMPADTDDPMVLYVGRYRSLEMS